MSVGGGEAHPQQHTNLIFCRIDGQGTSRCVETHPGGQGRTILQSHRKAQIIQIRMIDTDILIQIKKIGLHVGSADGQLRIKRIGVEGDRFADQTSRHHCRRIIDIGYVDLKTVIGKGIGSIAGAHLNGILPHITVARNTGKNHMPA